jgi:hypothetical protein
MINMHSTVVGANLCVSLLLEVKGKGIKGMGRVADKKVCTVPEAVLCSSLSSFSVTYLNYCMRNFKEDNSVMPRVI